MKVISVVAVALCMIATGISAQNVMTSSPYSMFGVGEISSGLYGPSVSMGGVSYGMRSSQWINMDNPAGLTAMDSNCLVGEISTFVKKEYYKSNGNSSQTLTGNFSAFTLGSRLLRGWYTAVGLLPYSSVGYYFQTLVPLEGTPSSYETTTFEGSGGLSKLYLSNAIQLPLNLSLGVNLNYIFGIMEQNTSQSTMSEKKSMDAKAFTADFGLQYVRKLSRTSTLSIGAVYGYKQKLTLKNTSTVTTSGSTTTSKIKGKSQYMPQHIGLGGALVSRNWTHALDYSFYQYHVLNSGDNKVKFRDSHELRYGISFHPQEQSSNKYWRQMSYNAGINASIPYYQISGKSGKTYRLSLGADFPVMNGHLHTALFYDNLKVTSDLRRSMFGLTLTYSFGERFYKAKL